MQVVDFSRYRRNLREIISFLKMLVNSLLIYVTFFSVLYFLTVIPAEELLRKKKMLVVFRSRYQIAKQDIILAKKNLKKWTWLYERFVQPDFAKFWKGLVLFLEEILPSELWIDNLVWEKDIDHGYVLLVKGGAIVESEDILKKKLREVFSLTRWRKRFSKLVDGIMVLSTDAKGRQECSYVVEVRFTNIYMG